MIYKKTGNVVERTAILLFRAMHFFAAIKNFILRHSRLLTTLHGHTGPITSISISSNGRLLASGGASGVKVWDLQTHKELVIPQLPFQERGQVSCVLWITRQNESFDTLCYGNALGYLVFLQHRQTEDRFESVLSTRIAMGGEILCLTADTSNSSTTRVATGTRDKCVQVWSFDSTNRKLIPIHSKAYGDNKDIVPKAVAFDNNTERDLFVFGLYDGGFGIDAKGLSKHQLGSHIGNAALDLERQLCVIDNAGNGFDLYKIDTGNFVKTLVVGEPKKTYPKGVHFGNGGRTVVGGSDHGCVYVFDRKSGRVVKIFKHSKEGGVETIAVCDIDGRVIIASASATINSGPNPICLWQWTPTESSNSDKYKRKTDAWTVMTILEWIVKLIILCAALAFFYEFLRGETAKLGHINIITPNEDMIREYIQAEIMRAKHSDRKVANTFQDEVANIVKDAEHVILSKDLTTVRRTHQGSA